MEPAVLAGTVSTALFASSNLPMLLKAARTRNLASYSLSNLVLSNVANGIHTFYVLSLPAGPIWALHGFYVVTMVFMLAWYLRFAPSRPGARSRSREGGDRRNSPCSRARTGPSSS